MAKKPKSGSERPPQEPDAELERRPRRWGRLSLVAVCAAGAVAVLVIATVHPGWVLGTPAPTFTLSSLSVSFEGSGESDVLATNVCVDACPATVSVGHSETVSFSVTPTAVVSCGASVYYTVTKVVESSTGGAFSISKVAADASASPLPVTIPNPLTGSECVTTAQIFVTFSVFDQGASRQSVALVATVTKS